MSIFKQIFHWSAIAGYACYLTFLTVLPYAITHVCFAGPPHCPIPHWYDTENSIFLGIFLGYGVLISLWYRKKLYKHARIFHLASIPFIGYFLLFLFEM